MARRLTIGCLLLWFIAGSAMAQDAPFVIKKGEHYLSHVRVGDTWVVKDNTTFHPDSCLWYSGTEFNSSGTNHNYYFFDGTNYRFLAAPLAANGTISLSPSLPYTYLLRNTDEVYYFFDWDPDDYGRGVARGKRYYEATSTTCQYEWKNNQCWEVYWVEYAGGTTWKLSDNYHYDITDNAGRFRPVEVTETVNVTSGGLTSLTANTVAIPSEGVVMNFGGNIALSADLSFPYEYTVNGVYTFEGTPHNHNTSGSAISAEYSWSITGEGKAYLSFNEGSQSYTSSLASPVLYYRTENATGDKTAMLTLNVSYNDGSHQTLSAIVTVKTACQNPGQAAVPTVTHTGVTVRWYPTTTSYTVYWKKESDSEWNSVGVGNVTSYTFNGLDYSTTYLYKVKAECDDDEPEQYSFVTKPEPGLIVVGGIYGGGRMADVEGKTEVVIVNCDSIGAIYGGNDIAGAVQNSNGSKIVLGVNDDDDPGYTYDDDYGVTQPAVGVTVGSVYGGGNGYYAYNGTSFVAAGAGYTNYVVAEDGVVKAMTQNNEVGEPVWTNNTGDPVTLNFPTISKSDIIVSNDYVRVDSLFGGAKNAFLTLDGVDNKGTSITVDGGTVFAVFGGNNIGGTLGTAKQYIEVNQTTIPADFEDFSYDGCGREFGIRYLFGGGNKVAGSTTDIHIKGGMMDTIFGGGNRESVTSANLYVTCSIGAAVSGPVFGKVYSDAIQSYDGETLTIKETGYGWNGTGIYNVRTLFGGNNRADMDGVPSITLSSGSIGTAYGGGNAGDMKASESGSIVTFINHTDTKTLTFNYGTKIEMTSPTTLVDYLYGGCQMSNVDYSTFVDIKNGHIGSVYGGCNVSGDVGSTRTVPSAPSSPPSEDYQAVKGGTYVRATGGTVYQNFFAGSNGFYHCNDGTKYKAGIDYADSLHYYIGMLVPTHNETHLFIGKDDVAGTSVTIKGDAYAGGNLACVGFTNFTVPYVNGSYKPYPQFVGLSSLHMDGGTVEGSVYGGGRMASVYGSNEVKVNGGTIGGALYGGNDRTGQVAQITNRVWPEDDNYDVASDLHTSLANVNTYVGITGAPDINTVYGGGNGKYDYENGDMEYCLLNDQPIQSNTFVDINIEKEGQIDTIYGGGNGVTVTGTITVFMNVNNPDYTQSHEHVGAIFGGNNLGSLDILPKIILLKGKVNTVYGGCNQGAMEGSYSVTQGLTTYDNVGSFVRLYDTYTAEDNTTVTPTALVTGAVYGGCRMNGVTNKSLVLVEGRDYSSTAMEIFGGSDISGHVGNSQVVVVNGSVNATKVNNIYGGGNGNYDYEADGKVYLPGSDHSNSANLVATGVTTAPTCFTSTVDIWGGQVGTTTNSRNIYGGGYGHLTSTTGDVLVNVGVVDAGEADPKPLIYGDVYGGSALGSVNTNTSNITTVNFLNGTIHGNVYGGGLGYAETNGNGFLSGGDVIEAVVNGTVHVNIGDDDETNYSNYLNIDGSVFGGNNLAGTPKGNVFVDVYRTAHTSGNAYPEPLPSTIDDDFFNDAGYALSEVYGGGNLAHYVPTLENASTYVHVHNCDNTIEYVYGGGNAADVPASEVIIDGGLVKYVFGGGNGAGTGNPGANVTGDNILAMNGGVMGYVFAGSNTKGGIGGETTLQFREIPYCDVRSVNELYGGGNEAPDENGITLNVPCGTADVKTIFGGAKNADVGTSGTPADIVLNVFGGDENLDEVFGGNNQGGIIWGNVQVNLYGGTLNKVYGGSNQDGDVKGTIQVNVLKYSDCPLTVNTIYGGGNEAAYTPNVTSPSPEVNVMHGTVNNAVFGGGKGSGATVTASPKVNIGYDATSMATLLSTIAPEGWTTSTPSDFPNVIVNNVFGGGDQAAVTGSTEINVYNGTVTHKLVGGGNEAGVSNNTVVNIRGGALCTTTEASKGIYGGCNESGTVGGTATVTLTGGTIGGNNNAANIHGGGYGQSTSVAGNVTVNFGEDNDTPNDYPLLYGDLYGGSALGTVNTIDNANTTTVNVYNGTIEGNIFGGGLGSTSVEAMVNGIVHVNIGKMILHAGEDPTFSGKAKLYNCDIYGCNNVKGSPQDEVYVDVYSTFRRPTDEVEVGGSSATYAIQNVFGGGNRAHYYLLDNESHKTHVYVHGCDNTSEFLYGGGNAANAYGVEIVVEGGRFREAYGGGNGLLIPANIGGGGIGFNFHGGHYGYTYEGSNRWGTNNGPVTEPPLLPAGQSKECESSVIESHFFGANQAEIYVEVLENTISCGEDFKFTNVYAGSRWAIIYGDVKLTVHGGTIFSLFGGSQGYSNFSADIRKYPTSDQIAADVTVPHKYSKDLRAFMLEHPDWAGKGGNVTLVVTGGTIGEVFGGCDVNGNVEGEITVIIADDDSDACSLQLGNVYGASNEANYAPMVTTNPTPQVHVLKGSLGMEHDFNGNGAITDDERFDGNVFGGGNRADITSNSKVVVGDGPDASVTIGGNVYGGGNEGNVDGSPQVIIVPDPPYTLTISTPSHGSVKASHFSGTSASIGEGVAVNLEATPDENYTFGSWTVEEGTNASVSYPYRASTTFIMGTSNATVTAGFVPTHTLTITSTGQGTVEVTDIHGLAVNNGAKVGEGAVLTIKAKPAPATSLGGYAFSSWAVSGGASVVNSTLATTTFTMGSADATLTANFTPAASVQLTLNSDPVFSGSSKPVFRVNSYEYTEPIYVAKGVPVIVLTDTVQGHAFNNWSATGVSLVGSNTTSPVISFTMGETDATLTANYISAPTLTLVANPWGMGTFKVNGNNYTNEISVPINGVVSVEATPADGYVFGGWVVNSGNGTLASTSDASTTLTMHNQNTSITANFIATHVFAVSTPSHGSVTVTDSESHIVNNGASIIEGAELSIGVTTDEGYQFGKWEVVSGNGTIANVNNTSTTFTMGTQNTTIKAKFAAQLSVVTPENGSVTVSGITPPAFVVEGTVLNIMATPAAGYVFSGWEVTSGNGTITNTSSATTTFTMGTQHTTIKANFEVETTPEP